MYVNGFQVNKVHTHTLCKYWLILMACQHVDVYSKSKGYGIAFIVRLYLHFLSSSFLRNFTLLLGIKYSYQIQTICTEIYSFKYSDLIQIIKVFQVIISIT